MRELPKLQIDLGKPESFGNLAEKLGEDDRRTVATDLVELIKIDEGSMADWAGKAQGHLDRVEEEEKQAKTSEEEGSGEDTPPSTELTLSAVIQFSARATDALLGEPDLAKASKPGGELLAQWVSDQIRTEDPNWTLDTDPLIVHMAVTGLGWRKRNFDDQDKVFHSYFVPSVGTNSVIVNSNIRSIERAPRITHQFERYPYEINRSIERGSWIDYDPKFDEADTQAPKKFYELDAWLDLDGDGIDEPWTIVISRDDKEEIVKITPRWSKKTITDTKDVLFFNPIRRFYPYRFLPDPKGGFFPMGFGRLLKRVEGSADYLLTSIVETAKSAAEDGGIMSGGAGMPESVEIKRNRITSVPLDGRPIADMTTMFPAKQVSPGSVQILDKIITLADRLAGTLNTLENAPASMTATLAKGLIDNGTQVQSAVHRRMVASMTQEFRQFVQMADAYDQLPEGAQVSDTGGIAVTADPQLATEMHRSALASIYMEMTQNPLVFNAQEAALRFGQTMRIPDPEKLVATPQAPQATPWEKMQGVVALMKQQTEKIKVTGSVAVQLTQSLLNMVEAAGGMQNNQAALLTMAQLEHAVQEMMTEAGNAGDGLNGMAGQSGNPGAGALPAPTAGGGGADLSGGGPGGPGAAGQGGGAA